MLHKELSFRHGFVVFKGLKKVTRPSLTASPDIETQSPLSDAFPALSTRKQREVSLSLSLHGWKTATSPAFSSNLQMDFHDNSILKVDLHAANRSLWTAHSTSLHRILSPIFGLESFEAFFSGTNAWIVPAKPPPCTLQSTLTAKEPAFARYKSKSEDPARLGQKKHRCSEDI